jgi:hypothetical protein
MNCCAVPKNIEGLAGFTVIETSPGTVSTVEPLIVPDVA